MIERLCHYLAKRKTIRQIKNKTANLNSLNDLDLSYMNLSNVDMRGAKMRASCLKKTVFKNTILQGATITSANLSGANLSGANLNYVNFSNSDLSGAKLRGARLYKAVFKGANLSCADFTDAKIDMTTDFTNANMTNAIIDINRLNIAITDGTIIQAMNIIDQIFYGLSIKSYNNKTKIIPINY